ncbi:MAG: DNA polymerase IV [Acidimicrobiia bacterium]|jgi:DNA polymerase-4|nr:DNA polymerase IV [Acidimicrobiia bacterium]MDQ3390217.1 DNA polymerase IV [Actinomycetota bacterium]
MVRSVLHVDMDAFYVSVELLRRPELRGRPVVVGGAGRRGVVAAASYEARRYGVYSAMPSAIARRRCPHAVFLHGDHALYSATSTQVSEIFNRFTPLVEPLSLDEAFLDVTGVRHLFGDARTIGERIRSQISDELSLSCSVGAAPNKFLAKLASVAAKPQVTASGVRPGEGVVVIEPGEEQAFLHPLAVGRIWGVGPVTLERLEAVGIHTVGDLAGADGALLASVLGARQATHLAALAVGHDDRPVEPERASRSISHESTFAHDLYDEEAIRQQIVRMADGVATRLRAGVLAARTITLKARYGDFTTITRSVTVAEPVSSAPDIMALVAPLLGQLHRERGVRLLGVVASKLGPPHRQLSFDDLDEVRHRDTDRAARAIDEVRSRFGTGAIGPASTLDAGGLNPVRQGADAWGPDDLRGPRRVEDRDETCETERRAEE